ncbi:MAG: MotA/TolQ/ExbB proton channel family protein [Magnetococcales bacterium]|nr:MotA/TolQ/ExbB proton channel family protein [Magnetococcales bacterium]
MDISTIIGLFGALLILAFLSAGKIAMFASMHAAVVVFGGLIASTFVKFSLHDLKNTGAILSKAFLLPKDNINDIIAQLVEMSNISRKDGILALEKYKTKNSFMQNAINHCVDGSSPEFLSEVMSKEIEYLAHRHHVGVVMFDSMGEAAPAMGMVGTLIGMVELLANMEDPSKIGPAMGTALLATCYGAIVANMMTIPIGIKLHHYSSEEQLRCQVIMDGIIGIQKGVNPRMLEQSLRTVLSSKEREAD